MASSPLLSFLFCLALVATLTSGAPTKAKRTPTLMISFDGFRASKLNEFLRNDPNSFLQREFVEKGVKAEYMLPSFPSLTFPNHFTLVTGLYMESHGITGNSFYDPNYNEKVNLLADSKSNDIRFWNGSEPIWLTAKKQGLKTASFFWTGSEVWTRHPDIFMRYSNSIQFQDRVDEVVNWFKKFNLDFGTLYFNEPDHIGHENGPDSEQYKNAIGIVDNLVGYLINRLAEENVLDNLNILIVSDHGMAAMQRTIIVKNYVDLNLVDSNKTLYGIVSNIYPRNESVKATLYNQLKQIGNLTVYYREELPERLHYQKNARIAPIVAIANEGYTMSTITQTLKGNHGFDNVVESMRAIFLARGPDFKKSHSIGPVKNVDVYPLLCQLIDMQCQPNNGTISTFLDALNNPPSAMFAQKNLNFE